MSRSGYSDDYEYAVLWEQAVRRATTGYRGQHLLRKLRDALDAMPVKRLIADDITDDASDVCALGALDPSVDGYDAQSLAEHFNVARALAAEIVYQNDEAHAARPWWEKFSDGLHAPEETPEERWTRMRAWVESQIVEHRTA